MGVLKDWILSIAGAVVVLGIVDIILPAGKMKKTVAVVSGFILMAVLMLPMFKIVEQLKSPVAFDFSGLEFEHDKSEIIDNRNLYTEDQLVQIASNYKRKLTDHIKVRVEAVSGVMEADCEVIIKEDYTKDDFGEILRIYVTARKGKKKESDPSRLGKVDRIEKIVISQDGIKIEKSGDQPPEDRVNAELAGRIKNEINDEFMIDEENIFVEIKN